MGGPGRGLGTSKPACVGSRTHLYDLIVCSALTAAAPARQATMEWEAQDEGFLAKILVADGAKDIAVGTPVAVVVDDAESVRDTPL